MPPAMALASLLSLSRPHASSRVLGSTSSKRRMTGCRHRCERNFSTIHRRVKTESSIIHVVSYHKAKPGPRMLTRNSTGVMTPFVTPRQRKYSRVSPMCLRLEKLRLFVATFLIFNPILSLIGCQKSQQPTTAPPDVEVVEVMQRDVPISKEWVGTLDGLVNAQIRPQVTGYLLRQNYKEGSFVKKGELLFRDRSENFPGGAGSSQRAARQCRAAARAG